MKDFYLYRHTWISAPHFSEQLSDEYCDALLKQGGWMVRNTYDFDQQEPSDFWYIIKDSFGGMEELSTDDRNQVRRALSRLEYKIIEKNSLVDQGYEIIKKAYDSFMVKDRTMNRRTYDRLLQSWDESVYDFWGAFDKNDGSLVGFAAVRLFDAGCFYDMVTFYPEYKHNLTYPYYGIFYKLNEYYLGERELQYVTDGSRSITEHSNIQPFLIQKFKFRKAYCKINIRYRWWFGVIVKTLYPFRNVIRNRSMKAVLLMHEIWKNNK